MTKKSKGPQKAKNRIKKELKSLLEKNPTQAYNFKQLKSKLKANSDIDQTHLDNAIAYVLGTDIARKEGVAKIRYNGDRKSLEEKFKNTVEGKMDISKNGAGFVITEQFDQDIYISPRHTGKAMSGDTVEVQLNRASKGRRPDGKVVRVVKRGKDTYVCALQLKDSFAFAVPTNSKMNTDFFIPIKKVGGANDGDLVLVKMTRYDDKQKNPVGEVIAVLGEPGDHKSEMNAIILDHGLPISFPSEVISAADKIKDEITSKEIEKRRDFRDILTFTIDPWDAKDFDDALSFKQIDDDTFEIGVHIADVTHYVKPNDTIDKEAQERATSVYLVDRVIPMLPERLSNQICSLRPKEDKCCFAAVFHVNRKGEVKDRWFGRTIIHSDRRFTYEEAQERIEGKGGDLAKEINILNDLAQKLRRRRFREGAVAFDREEMRFKLDDKGAPIDIVIKVSKEAHKLIEEFMLLANREVAENFRRFVRGKKTPPFVYRVHDQPDDEKLNGLKQMAVRFGYDFHVTDKKNASKAINKLLKECKGKPEENMLSTLAIRSMSKAKYTTDNVGHYGLAFKNYTHFTSPIRRYPDVMVHRLLAQYLDGNGKVDGDWLEDQCNHSSEKEVEAEQAERDSTKYKMVEYMEQYVGDEFDGFVSGVTDHTLFVELSNKCEGGVRLSDIIDDSYFFDQDNYQIKGNNTGKTYALGDKVKVRVIACNLEKRFIELDLLK